MKIRVLVTGATGFVGSHIVEAMQGDESIDLIVACRDRRMLLPNINAEVREGDLLDDTYLDTLVKNVDVICHAAAWSSLWGHAKESKAYFLEPSLKLIDKAKAAGVKKVIFPSTLSAVSPTQQNDPMRPGIKRAFWPHLCNVIEIENHLRTLADKEFTTVVMRLGFFAGRRYGLGMLPILLPRLKTHLVPWVDHGNAHIPIIDGRDIGQAFHMASVTMLEGYEAFNITGAEQPDFRELLSFIHKHYGYPLPHFSVPFGIAYPFAWLMEMLDHIAPWDPLVTRSIVHLLEETGADYHKAHKVLGYTPQYDWRDAVSLQIDEMLSKTTFG